jgi:DNA-binding response OmpR family regulator
VNRRRVLVVDDWQDSAITTAALLAQEGYETRVATCGLDALDLADREPPDAVLLDLGLPDISGYEVCRRLRQRPLYGDLLIIALTAWTRESDRTAAADAGFDYYVLKPASLETLHVLLQGVERRRHPR